MSKIKLQKNINTNEKYTWQDYEEKILSPLAMKSKYSKGRKHYEKEHPYRSLYQRDRDRIVHCAAFRRLEYKTQVFVYHEGDYFRTRLTHTLEVAQIARTISRNLKLNDDLTEAIALVHDVGHTPFGHAVEAVLNELMQEDGGFNHNEQGLRVVDFLEERYPSFKGLNLSWETREGIVKHSTNVSRNFAKRYAEFKPNEQPSLETQVMDVSDEIAYDNHDVDDGIKSGLIFEDDLRKKSKLWSTIYKKVKTEHSNLNSNLSVYLTIRNLINRQVTDLLDNTSRNIKKFKLETFKDVRICDERIVAFSPEMNALRGELREFLFKNLYCNWHVLRMTDKAKRFVSALFDIYLHNPQLLPPPFRNEVQANGVKRTICDYLAGMTDKYALEEYSKFFNPYEKV